MSRLACVVFFQDRLLFGSAKFSLNWCCRYSCELIYTVSFNLASPTCKFLWMEDYSLFFACFFQLFIINFSNYSNQFLLIIDDSIIIIQNSGFSKPKYSLINFMQSCYSSVIQFFYLTRYSLFSFHPENLLNNQDSNTQKRFFVLLPYIVEIVQRRKVETKEVQLYSP